MVTVPGRLLVSAVLVAVLALAGTPARADQTAAELDSLFARLKETGSPLEGILITRRIWGLWTAYDDAAVARDLEAGTVAMAHQDYETALAAFDRVVAAAPGFAEGWNKRATLFYLMGEYDRSMADIERVLALEPRHFGAISGIGLIYMALEDDEAALAAFRKALEINPFMPGVMTNIRTLRKRMRDKQI